MALTQEGAELLPGVRRGLDELRRAVDRIRRERVGGMLNLSVPNEFLQRWLLPRLGEFTRRHPEIEVRFGPAARRRSTSAATTSTPRSVYGTGQWPGLKAERLLDEWVFPVCSPALLAKLGPIETLADFARYPLIHSRSEPWVDWLRRVGGDTTRAETVPLLEDASATLAAVEQGKGVALARWSLVAADLAAGPPGAADDAERAAAERLVPGRAARALLAAQGRALPRLAARLLPRVRAAHRRDAPRRTGRLTPAGLWSRRRRPRGAGGSFWRGSARRASTGR